MEELERTELCSAFLQPCRLDPVGTGCERMRVVTIEVVISDRSLAMGENLLCSVLNGETPVLNL